MVVPNRPYEIELSRATRKKQIQNEDLKNVNFNRYDGI